MVLMWVWYRNIRGGKNSPTPLASPRSRATATTPMVSLTQFQLSNTHLLILFYVQGSLTARVIPLNLSDWSYKNEGASNVILSYVGVEPDLVRIYCVYYPEFDLFLSYIIL